MHLRRKESSRADLFIIFCLLICLVSELRANLFDFISDSSEQLPAIYENPKIYNVGAVLSSGQNIHEFSQVKMTILNL